MSKQNKVSVIVPVYNEERYLRDANRYITEQTLQDIEIIYVDDGSTDDTVNILKEIEAADDRITVLHQQNCYAGVARNKGLEIASGKYVVFWDSDDIFHPDALEKMYNQCEADQADVCVCGANHYDEVTGKLLAIKTYLKEDLLPENIPFERKDIDNYIYNFTTNVPWNKMYRTSFIKENNLQYQAIKQANDNYFTMMAFYCAKKFTVVREPLIDYRINYGASLTGQASNTPFCVYEAFTKTYEELRQKPDFDNIKQSFLNKTLRSLCYFLSKQTTFESYKMIYDKYKTEVIEKWGFPEEETYYYVAKDYGRLCEIRESDAVEFLLKEYKMAFDANRLLRDTKAKQKEKIATQKEKIEGLKERRDQLKEKVATQKEKIATQKERIEGLKERRDQLKEKVATQKEKIEGLKERRDQLKEKVATQKEKIATQKERIESLKERREQLKEQNRKLNKTIKDIKSSSSYKIGRIITYIPRKIKELLKGRK